MSQLGKRWEIDGVAAAYIVQGSTNGSYIVTFERSETTLEAIEAIHWEKPEVKCLLEEQPFGLPEGYGFELADVRYDHKAGVFRAEVRTQRQYLGDVSAYEAQMAQLKGALTARETEKAALSAALAEETAKQETMTAHMQAAYEEGVESHG